MSSQKLLYNKSQFISSKNSNVVSQSKNIDYCTTLLLDYIELYNELVELYNIEVINQLQTEKDNGRSKTTSKQGGTITVQSSEIQKSSTLIDNFTGKLISSFEINLLYKEIKKKTIYYWYDDENEPKQPEKLEFVKSLLQRLKKKVIPFNEQNKTFYLNETITTKSGQTNANYYIVTQENTYIESLEFLKENEINDFKEHNLYYVCFNEHPFNKIKLSKNSDDSLEITDYIQDAKYYMWLYYKNDVYIYTQPTQEEIITILNNKYRLFNTISKKQFLMLHPYHFYNKDSNEINDISMYTIDRNPNQTDSEICNVHFLQGRHYLCWLCAILNAIKFYGIDKKDENIIPELLKPIKEAMETQSVIHFIKSFDYKNKNNKILDFVGKKFLNLRPYNRGNFPSMVSFILKSTGIGKLSEQFKNNIPIQYLHNKTNVYNGIENPLPFQLVKLHVLPLMNGYYHDSLEFYRRRISHSSLIPFFIYKYEYKNDEQTITFQSKTIIYKLTIDDYVNLILTFSEKKDVITVFKNTSIECVYGYINTCKYNTKYDKYMFDINLLMIVMKSMINKEITQYEQIKNKVYSDSNIEYKC